MIVFVTLQTFLHINWVEFVLLQREQDLSIDWDWILADYDSLETSSLALFNPLMTPYILNCIALGRVGIEDFFHQISALRRDELRNGVVGRQYFLIKLRGVWIFKWQVAAHKCE